MVKRRDWVKGDIESLILYLISQRPVYGYQVIKELETRSEGYFRFKEGTLYPVLHRLERSGLVVGEWQKRPGGRQRKYYHITEKGQAAVAERANQWQDFLTAMNLIFSHTSG